MKQAAMILAVALLVSSAAFADTEGCATASVLCNVDPNVSVGANTALVDAGTVQTGDFFAMICYRVDANLQFVTLACDASMLYKGSDPLGTEVAPIPLNMTAGICIIPDNANPVQGGSNIANYTGNGQPISNFPTFCTAPICFESSQNNHFSQDIWVKVTWTQDDPEKPTGEYCGKVKMRAMLLPA